MMIAFSAALEQLYMPVPISEFAPQLFSSVSILFPDLILTFDCLNNRTGTLTDARNFEPPNPEEYLRQLAVNIEREHPAVAYVRGGGSERTLRLSDFLTQRKFRRTALYHENFKLLDVSHQVAVLLPIRGHVAGLTLSRGTEFGEEELMLIRLLCPHILRAHASAQLFSALRSKCQDTEQVSASGSKQVQLTAREAEVFQWLAAGKRDREIGVILGISHRTVEKHVQRIFAKLGVETRIAAAAEFRRDRNLTTR